MCVPYDFFEEKLPELYDQVLPPLWTRFGQDASDYFQDTLEVLTIGLREGILCIEEERKLAGYVYRAGLYTAYSACRKRNGKRAPRFIGYDTGVMMLAGHGSSLCELTPSQEDCMIREQEHERTYLWVEQAWLRMEAIDKQILEDRIHRIPSARTAQKLSMADSSVRRRTGKLRKRLNLEATNNDIWLYW